MSRKVKSLYEKLLIKSDFGCAKSCLSVNFTQLLLAGNYAGELHPKDIFKIFFNFGKDGEELINFNFINQFQIDYQTDMPYILTTKIE